MLPGETETEAILSDALRLLCNQGEIFISAGMVFLDPAFATEMLKPLVDHRLSIPFVLRKVRDAAHAKVLVAGVDALVKYGEVRPHAHSRPQPPAPPCNRSSSCALLCGRCDVSARVLVHVHVFVCVTDAAMGSAAA